MKTAADIDPWHILLKHLSGPIVLGVTGAGISHIANEENSPILGGIGGGLMGGALGGALGHLGGQKMQEPDAPTNILPAIGARLGLGWGTMGGAYKGYKRIKNRQHDSHRKHGSVNDAYADGVRHSLERYLSKNTE